MIYIVPLREMILNYCSSVVNCFQVAANDEHFSVIIFIVK